MQDSSPPAWPGICIWAIAGKQASLPYNLFAKTSLQPWEIDPAIPTANRLHDKKRPRCAEAGLTQEASKIVNIAADVVQMGAFLANSRTFPSIDV